jgi:hypothetical protein
MRRFILLFAVAALGMIGAAAPAGAANDNFQATFRGEVTYVLPPGGCLTTHTEAVGNVAQLARVSMVSNHCAAANFENGLMTITFPCGSTLTLGYSGGGPFDPADPPSIVHLEGEWHVVGGTFLLEGAEGSGTFRGELKVGDFPPTAPWPVVLTYAGTLEF